VAQIAAGQRGQRKNAGRDDEATLETVIGEEAKTQCWQGTQQERQRGTVQRT
jgi:hypothetical protein